MLLIRECRFGSGVFLAAYLVYFVVALPFDAMYSFSVCVYINLFIGLALIKKHRMVSLLSFLTVLVNVAGFMMYHRHYEMWLYNNISLMIIATQAALLAIEGLRGLLYRDSLKLSVVRDSNSSNNKQGR